MMLLVKKKAAKYFLLTVWCLLIMEISIRVISVRKDHVEYIFGKPWYYLVPFDTPRKMPSVISPTGNYRQYDKDLGWTIGEFGAAPPLYYSDSQGVRCSLRAYKSHISSDANQPPKKYDVICLGDSFTHGDEVLYEESWPAQLGQISGLQVANLGVGGYGVDQAMLRYVKKGVKAKMVILGLIAGDFERTLTQVYNFTNGGLKTKPMYVFSDFGDSLLNSPAIYGDALLKEFQKGERSDFFQKNYEFHPLFFRRDNLTKVYLFRLWNSMRVWKALRRPPIYRTVGRELDYQIKLLGLFNRTVERDGGRFLIVLLENNNSFSDRQGGKNPWEILEKELNKASIDYINTAESIASLWSKGSQIINPKGVHYTPYANTKVADLIANSKYIKNISAQKL